MTRRERVDPTVGRPDSVATEVRGDGSDIEEVRSGVA
jgi:hypothetical protein